MENGEYKWSLLLERAAELVDFRRPLELQSPWFQMIPTRRIIYHVNF